MTDADGIVGARVHVGIGYFTSEGSVERRDIARLRSKESTMKGVPITLLGEL